MYYNLYFKKSDIEKGKLFPGRDSEPRETYGLRNTGKRGIPDKYKDIEVKISPFNVYFSRKDRALSKEDIDYLYIHFARSLNQQWVSAIEEIEARRKERHKSLFGTE